MSAFFQNQNDINSSISKSNSYSYADAADPYSERPKNNENKRTTNNHENNNNLNLNDLNINDKNEIINNTHTTERVWGKKEKKENPFREKKEIFKDPYDDGSDDIGFNDKYKDSSSIKKDEVIDNNNNNSNSNNDNNNYNNNGEQQIGMERLWSKVGSKGKEKKTNEDEETLFNHEIDNEDEDKQIEELQEKEKEKGKEKMSLTKTAGSADDLTRHNPFRKNGK